MSVKSLRLEKSWSQEQLAQLSGLNVRTIQRLEKGESVGIETIKSLAAVFEISTQELNQLIEQQSKNDAEHKDDSELVIQGRLVKEKVKNIKYFYIVSAFLSGIFLLFLLPHYDDGKNLGALIAVFFCFAGIIAAHAIVVFQPFGDKWEQKIQDKLLHKQKSKK